MLRLVPTTITLAPAELCEFENRCRYRRLFKIQAKSVTPNSVGNDSGQQDSLPTREAAAGNETSNTSDDNGEDASPTDLDVTSDEGPTETPEDSFEFEFLTNIDVHGQLDAAPAMVSDRYLPTELVVRDTVSRGYIEPGMICYRKHNRSLISC